MKMFSSEKCLAAAAIIAAILFALPLMLQPAIAEEAQPTTMYVVNVTSWLNGREEPDKDSSVAARFTVGTDVDVYEVSGNWAKVKGGECGYVWCSVAYLSSTPPDAEPQGYTVRSNGRVRVRETPNGDLVRWLEAGDTVQVQSWFDGWAYIGDGYVIGKWPGGGLEAVE